MDVKHEFHTDHVFPKSQFTKGRLRAAGLADADIESAQDRVNRLPNLQLLEGSVNISKQAALPLKWATDRFPGEHALGLYLAGHDLAALPAELLDFPSFYESREDLIRERLTGLLGVSAGNEVEVEAPEELLPLQMPDATA